MKERIKNIVNLDFQLDNNLIVDRNRSAFAAQNQTIEMFSEKWLKNETAKTIKGIENFNKKWYLQLYGFESENELATFLQGKKIILDAGCGLGYKAAWFAKLAPGSVVIGMDFSDSIFAAAKYFRSLPNLFFIQGDISDSPIKKQVIDFISCDQVIHHTEFPEKTFSHMTSLLKSKGQICCYVYAKKSLPRELLDEYFRKSVFNLSKDELWHFSEQVTELGKRLIELDVSIDVPEIPLLGIKAGKLPVQRFIYWNFLKCFWNEEFGWENSVATNFDWYAPSNAARYTKEEFMQWGIDCNLETIYSHSEEACHTARFMRA